MSLGDGNKELWALSKLFPVSIFLLKNSIFYENFECFDRKIAFLRKNYYKPEDRF